MTPPALDLLRACFEGFVPAMLATCDGAGAPNVSLISQVHYVDPERVALSYQFFNKTRANLLATGRASVGVVDPATLAEYRLDLAYEETQTEGAVFESMRAKLAGIASHAGMQGVFHLLGADIFRVARIETVRQPAPILPQPGPALLAGVRRTCAELALCPDLGELFDRTLACLVRYFGLEHAMLLMVDEEAGGLYTVASTGYPNSGIGSEIALGAGVIGVAARERAPIRIGAMTSDYRYGAAAGEGDGEIPYPGLAEPESQIAVPVLSGGRLLGVIFAESRQPMRFGHAEEDALAIVADRLGSLIRLAQQGESEGVAEEPAPEPEGRPILVRHYPADDSVFLDHDYLIKGVAGAIFWKLVREHARGRVEFTNRELRLDPSLRLPEHAENLEARLVLLERRLRERGAAIRIEKCGRGRFRLGVACALTLEEVGAA